MQNQAYTTNKKLISIIAPPRTCSTLVLSIFSNNPDTTGLHEPEKVFKGYSEGLETLEESKKEFVKRYKTDTSITVAKNMTQWITINPFILNYILDNSNTILILIRDPFLTFESKIRKHLESFLLKNGNQKEDKVRYAKELLYSNNSNYLKHLEYILGKQIVFGWNELPQIIKEIQDKGIDYIILDTTQLRENPKRCLTALERKLELPYKLSSQINWAKIEETELFQIQGKPYQKNWYDRISRSNKILPPVEKLLYDYNKYPEYIKKDLNEAIKIYNDLKDFSCC